MDYCIKCDVQMIHKEDRDICPNCGYQHLDEEPQDESEPDDTLGMEQT